MSRTFARLSTSKTALAMLARLRSRSCIVDGEAVPLPTLVMTASISSGPRIKVSIVSTPNFGAAASTER